MSQTAKKILLSALLLLSLLMGPVRRCAAAAGLALLAAAAANRPVSWLERRRVPRWLGALLVVGGAVSGALLALWTLASRLCGTVHRISPLFPDLSTLFRRLSTAAAVLPEGMGALARQGLELLNQRSSAIPGQITAWAARVSGRVLSTLPEKLFFLLIVVLCGFYAASDWPNLRRQLGAVIPAAWRRHVLSALHSLKRGLTGWLRAQGLLMLIQFLVLTAGLSVLHIRGAGAAAALVALADAMPLLGTGAVLLPWAALLWLEGHTLRALGVCLLTLVCWLTRTMLEPRLVGKQAGLSPFFTLLAMYLGLQCFGLPGLIGVPVAAAAAAQLKGHGL